MSRTTEKRAVPDRLPTNDKIVPVPTDRLLLDAENPRLAMQVGLTPRRTELVEVLWKEMAVDEVALSIAANGFYPSEPLLVIPERQDKPDGPYVVVEGNRRLAAVLLLRDAALRKKVGATDLPRIDKKRHDELAELPVIKSRNREELWTTVGFRHINGTKGWDSYSKAKYVHSVHTTYGIPLTEIARRIGDQYSTVQRLYRGYAVLLQAEKDTPFDVGNIWPRKLYFSHLYTALDQREFQEFLGLRRPDGRVTDSVPKRRLGCLEELLTWLYGRREPERLPVVKTQAFDLGRLRRVVGDAGALNLLRKTGRLDDAYNETVGDVQRLMESLAAAKLDLQTANATAPTGYKGGVEPMQTAQEIVDLAESLHKTMKTRYDAKQAKR